MDIKEVIGDSGIIAVLEIEDVADAVPVAKALVRGGIDAIELALRTPAAEPSIERIAKEVPEMKIGIGTIIIPGQAEKVKKLGAAFGVAPGLNPDIMAEAKRVGLPFAPGISSPSELEKAISLGYRTVKLFPAEPLGGVAYLKSMNAPYNYLGLSYIPLGGVSLANLESWAKAKMVSSVGGSWIAKRDLIKAHAWDQIEKNASEAMELWKKLRAGV